MLLLPDTTFFAITLPWFTCYLFHALLFLSDTTFTQSLLLPGVALTHCFIFIFLMLLSPSVALTCYNYLILIFTCHYSYLVLFLPSDTFAWFYFYLLLLLAGINFTWFYFYMTEHKIQG